jgi:RNA polymerase sigma factor (TIGR02999 family)
MQGAPDARILPVNQPGPEQERRVIPTALAAVLEPAAGKAADVSRLVASADAGDVEATAALFTLLYSELHRLARRQLAHGAHGLTLGTTTLLHEAYLDMAERAGSIFPDRSRFMAYASRVMRGLIIDYVRTRKAQKRGGQFEIAPLSGDVARPAADDRALSRIGAAIDQLAEVEAELAQVVDLKFFCGFSFAEIAAMRGLSERTVQRQWEKARIYLHRVLGEAGAP